MGLKTHRAKGQQKNNEKVLRLPSIQQLKVRMRQMIW
jgi:hypothetical protein